MAGTALAFIAGWHFDNGWFYVLAGGFFLLEAAKGNG